MARFLRAILALCGIVALSFGPAHADTAKRKVIIDDEGFGLMHLMLLESSQVDVVGITTVSGNTWANRATAMALRGLEIAQRPDVPVAEGATYPLLNSEVLTDRWEALYGKLTWKGAWMKQWVEPTQQSTPAYFGPADPVNLPEGNPKLKASGEIAANFLIRMVRKYPGQITIVACGPLTNLALAQRLDPQFASLVGELVYMGGSLNPHRALDNVSAEQFAREFANSPRREFNARFDPEAASIVSRSPWRKLTVIPVDPSTATQLTPDLIARMSKAAAPDLGKFIAAMEPGFPLWDEIAAGYVLDPGMTTDAEDLYVDYDTQFGPAYGDMLSWREHYQPGIGERKAHVVRAIDAGRLGALMVETMAEGARRPSP
ncbi:Inosine-uridine nucleoside N-ribohydrolase [Novosphingobium sp. CF614]|uniref:nucleoside hydrolase n=1 Tax=Novosphingobium sp. CF614 TaxID=1884364 RepID=UPI0008EDB9D2|nr:nucleoside hydrolase [Novosphingobium sp. CF614]SFF86225.1 Inosine-uridine nucleoside N-ribohydrolase [Novosphingobium sp. CF614]